MNSKQALAKRDQLRGEIENARQTREKAAARLRQIEEEIKGLDKRRAADLRDQARGGKAAAIERLDAEKAELRREAEHATATARAAAEATKEAQREFDRLHRDEFEAFADHAESLTVEAMGKLARTQEPYTAAYEAWNAARAEWNRLARLNDLDPCPHPPLPEPSAVFAARPPRPPQVESPDGPGPVIDAPVEPEPGTLRTWESEDGRSQTARVGESLDRALAADPSWRVVEVAPVDA